MKIFFLIFAILTNFICFGQGNVGIGTTTPHASSIFDVQSTTKGVTFPSMTTNQRKAIVNPNDGLIVYDTDFNSYFYFKIDSWVQIKNNKKNNFEMPIKFNFDHASQIEFLNDYCAVRCEIYNPNFSQAIIILKYENNKWNLKDTIFNIQGEIFLSKITTNDYLFVEQPYENNNKGRVKIYKRLGENWNFFQDVSHPESQVDDHFGSQVTVVGNLLFVSAPDRDSTNNSNITYQDVGKIYIYLLSSSFLFYSTINSPDFYPSLKFGTQIASTNKLLNNILLVGSQKPASQNSKLYEYEINSGSFNLDYEYVVNGLNFHGGIEVTTDNSFRAITTGLGGYYHFVEGNCSTNYISTLEQIPTSTSFRFSYFNPNSTLKAYPSIGYPSDKIIYNINNIYTYYFVEGGYGYFADISANSKHFGVIRAEAHLYLQKIE